VSVIRHFRIFFGGETSYLIDAVEKQERAARLPALAIAFIWVVRAAALLWFFL
jgi:hypothetical protein